MLLDDAATFIGKLEGFRSDPYQDVGGVWTIGYGTTVLPNGQRVTADTPPVTQETALSYLSAFLKRETLPVVQTVGNWKRLNENQQIACLSMAYNIGPETFVNQTSVARAIEAWALARVPADFMLWDKVTIAGKLVTSRGLSNRRLAEATKFQTPMSTSLGWAL